MFATLNNIIFFGIGAPFLLGTNLLSKNGQSKKIITTIFEKKGMISKIFTQCSIESKRVVLQTVTHFFLSSLESNFLSLKEAAFVTLNEVGRDI